MVEPAQAPSRPLPPRPVGQRLRDWVVWFGPGRLVVSAVSVVAVAVGAFLLLRAPRPPVEASLPYAASTSAVGSTTSSPVAGSTSSTVEVSVPATIVVHVAGAVAAPGVYALDATARVVDAIAAAGGITADADGGAVNLAAHVRDGERVYVPRIGEQVPAVVAGSGGGGAPVAVGSTPVGPVDLNSATAEQLDALPGVGPATAAAIVAYRDAHGPFASVDALADVRGIGPAKLDALRGLVTV